MAKKNTMKKTEEVMNSPLEDVRMDLEAARSAAREEVASCSTTSAKIRLLSAMGHPTGEISKILNIRYQHVRNVLTTPLKRPLAKKQKEEATTKAE